MIALYIAVAVGVLYYAGAPLIVFAILRLRTNAPWQHIVPDDLPAPVSNYFGQTAPALISAGFEIRAYIKITGMLAGSADPNYIALWCHPVRGHMACQVSMGGKSYVEFSTVLADAFTLDTGNQQDIGAFARRADKNSFRAPTQDIEQLYRAHCYREHEHLRNDTARFLPAPGQEAAEFIKGVRRDLQEQCKVGDIREVKPDIFGPTIPGAFTMTWKQLPPWAQIRKARSDAAWKALERRMQSAALPQTSPRLVTALTPARR